MQRPVSKSYGAGRRRGDGVRADAVDGDASAPPQAAGSYAIDATSILIDITSKELRARLRRVLHLDEDLAHARRVPRRRDGVGLQIDERHDALPRVR